jgi:hypothetical protein
MSYCLSGPLFVIFQSRILNYWILREDYFRINSSARNMLKLSGWNFPHFCVLRLCNMMQVNIFTSKKAYENCLGKINKDNNTYSKKFLFIIFVKVILRNKCF